MRRIALVLLMVLLALIVVACSDKDDKTTSDISSESSADKNNKSGESGSNDQLNLQLLKEDEDNGATIEGHNIYSELDQIIKDNPTIGEQNDFSIFVVNSIYDESGNAKILMLAVNRLPNPIKNLTFNYTLGTEEGEYVFEKQHVTMDESTAGILQPNSTFPLILSITPEQDEILKTIDESNQVVKVEDFTFETE